MKDGIEITPKDVFEGKLISLEFGGKAGLPKAAEFAFNKENGTYSVMAYNEGGVSRALSERVSPQKVGDALAKLKEGKPFTALRLLGG